MTQRRLNLMGVLKADLAFFTRSFYSKEADEKKLGIFSILRYILYPEFALVFWYRIYSALCSSNIKYVRWIGVLLYFRTKIKYASDISPQSNIGVPFKVGHHMGIVIGPAAVIGNYVYIFNGVTIGNKNVGVGENHMPHIGNYVVIGTGAKLLGGLKVSDHTVVGANSVLLTSTQEHQVWAGIPAIHLQ